MERPNVAYKLILEWNGIDYENEVPGDGYVTEVDKATYKNNNGKIQYVAEGALNIFDGVCMVTEMIFAHPESGCLWFYAEIIDNNKETGQHVRVDVDCYETIGCNNGQVDLSGFTEMPDLNIEDLPF